MKQGLGLALALFVTACATGGGTTAGLTARQTVVIDSTTYDVGQLTESTWTAIARSPIVASNKESAGHRAALLTEIERFSKCRVTDSDYSREGRQLDAQIDCARRLQN